MTEIEIFIKREQIRALLTEVYEPEMRYFDRDSNEMLDEKKNNYILSVFKNKNNIVTCITLLLKEFNYVNI